MMVGVFTYMSYALELVEGNQFGVIAENLRHNCFALRVHTALQKAQRRFFDQASFTLPFNDSIMLGPDCEGLVHGLMLE